MAFLLDLWLPIGASAFAVFVVSAVIWMATPLHKKDFNQIEDDGSFNSAVRSLKPGFYMFPAFTPREGEDAKACMDRYKQGPWGVLTVWAKAPNFALNLLRTFLVFLVVCVLVAYVTSAGTGPAPSYTQVFQLAGAAALLGYTFGGLPNDIFFGKPTRFCITSLIEAILYTLVTAGMMAWLWPGRV